MGKLTALKVKNAKTGKHGDGDGLFLAVSNTGSRKWVLRIQVSGNRRDIGLGSASVVSLLEAREAAQEMRKAFKRGEDPVAKRRHAREAIPTFRDAAKMVHAEHAPGWKNAKHAAQWLSTLETYAFPKLGDLPVSEIDGPMVRDVLAEIWLTIPETARRVRQRIGTVLDFAHAKGWREAEAPMRSVSRGLPKQPRTREHLAAMPWQNVPSFLAEIPDTLRAGEPVRLALEFLILTAARSGEVRGMCWSEIDLEKRSWTIPAGRMKAGRSHRVPLSGRAVEILKCMYEMRRTDQADALIFEGQKPGKPLSDITLIMPLKRAGIPYTVHGFRSAFRDWCGEATNTPREVAEACLAHALQNRVEDAYARTDHFEKRRAVMDKWAAFLSGAAGNIVPMNRSIKAS
ncbi:MAG: integrase [Alphaproteobacteria bacterium]|jgi:integrase